MPGSGSTRYHSVFWHLCPMLKMVPMAQHSSSRLVVKGFVMIFYLYCRGLELVHDTYTNCWYLFFENKRLEHVPVMRSEDEAKRAAYELCALWQMGKE